MKNSTIFVLSLLAASTNVLAEKYVPIISKTLHITSSNIKCNLSKTEEYKETRDWCDASASIAVRVTLEQMRSIPSLTGDGKTTPDAKIVRFIVDEDNGGTGIHLVDELKQDNSWFQSWANRRTYIGPFATNYDLWVKPIKGTTPTKVKDFPANANTNYQHRDKHGVDIGVNGTAGAEVGKDGPKISGQVSGSFSISNEKTLVFETKDYRVVNSSSLSDFSVSFERGFDDCHYLRAQELGCYFTKAHWGSGWVYDKSKFNPISYANFKPNYEVIYEAPVSEKGTTTFELGIKVGYKVLFGSIMPSPLFSVYEKGGGSSNASTVTTEVSVDWNHPLFAPEAHVALQSLSDNNFCLDVYGTNDDGDVEVGGWECHGDWNQVWGLDDKERYKSRVAPERCLAVLPDKTVTVDFCGESLAQKWYWKEDQLVSRYVDGTDKAYVLNIIEGNKVGVAPMDAANKSKWQPRLHKINL